MSNHVYLFYEENRENKIHLSQMKGGDEILNIRWLSLDGQEKHSESKNNFAVRRRLDT